MSINSIDEYRQIMRCDFMSFVERSFYELTPQTAFLSSPHIEKIASVLEACRQGKIKRLIINLPPRSLKSHCASVAFPAWLLGHNPSARIICVSYAQDLSDKLARDCRTLMNSNFYRGLFPRAKLSASKQSVSEFVTAEQGFRLATSVGGTLTGRGADFIIIDDPIKPTDALSETVRNSCNDWYDNTLISRLNDKVNGCVIIIMQRLHQNDLTAHVLEQEGWEVLSFPAIAEEDETHIIEDQFGRTEFKRKVGEALQPNREPLTALIKIRETIGDYNFLSQYQQQPAPLGGAMIKLSWLRHYEQHEKPQRFYPVVQSWDTAIKEGDLNDYSVCVTFGISGKYFYLLDVFRKRLNYPDLKRAVLQQQKKHDATVILIEDKASGCQLIQDLKADGVYGVKPYEPPAGTTKIMRLHAQTAMFEGGFVLLPVTKDQWLLDYVSELTTFPGSRYDDQVDATTQVLDHMKQGMSSLAVWEKLGEML